MAKSKKSSRRKPRIGVWYIKIEVNKKRKRKNRKAKHKLKEE